MKNLKELFEKHAPLSDFKRTGDYIFCFFEVNNKEYIVVFYDTHPSAFRMYKNMFDLTFPHNLSSNNYGIAFGLLNEEFDKRNPLQSLMQQNFIDKTSNTGDVFLIFSTVGHAIMKFSREYPINAMYFAAQEANRYTLYPTLGKRLAKELNLEFYSENNFYIIYKKDLRENRINSY